MSASAAMLSSFDHVTVAVHDVNQAHTAYAQLLGSPALWRGGHPELGSQGAIFGLVNGALELTGPSAHAPEAEGLRQLLASRGQGMQALAFGTDDALLLSRTLRERGVRATPPQEGEARSDEGQVRSYSTVELSPRSARGLSLLAVQRPDPAALRATREPAHDVVHALDHIVLRTADPEAALALYGGALGLRLALDQQLGPVRVLFFRLGGVTLEVVHDASAGDVDQLSGLAYRVRDIDAAQLRIQAAGFDVSEVRAGMKQGTRVFTVRDAPGNVPTLILRDPARD